MAKVMKIKVYQFFFSAFLFCPSVKYDLRNSKKFYVFSSFSGCTCLGFDRCSALVVAGRQRSSPSKSAFAADEFPSSSSRVLERPTGKVDPQTDSGTEIERIFFSEKYDFCLYFSLKAKFIQKLATSL